MSRMHDTYWRIRNFCPVLQDGEATVFPAHPVCQMAGETPIRPLGKRAGVRESWRRLRFFTKHDLDKAVVEFNSLMTRMSGLKQGEAPQPEWEALRYRAVQKTGLPQFAFDWDE